MDEQVKLSDLAPDKSEIVDVFMKALLRAGLDRWTADTVPDNPS